MNRTLVKGMKLLASSTKSNYKILKKSFKKSDPAAKRALKAIFRGAYEEKYLKN